MSMSIGWRLVLGFGLIVLLSLLLSMYQLHLFRDAMRYFEAVGTRDMQVHAYVTRIVQSRAALRSIREQAITEAALAAGRGRYADQAADRYRTETERALASVGQLEAHARNWAQAGASPERRRLWGELRQEASDLGGILREVTHGGQRLVALLGENRLPDALAMREKLEAGQRLLDDELVLISRITEKLTQSGRDDIAENYQAAVRSALLAIIGVILLGAVAAFLIGRSIAGPLAQFGAFVMAVGAGDLTRRLPERGGSELQRFGGALNDMAGALGTIAGQTVGLAEAVNAATAQIRASSQEQAAAVAEQLSAIEETTATLSEITQSGAQITRRVQEVEHSALATVQASDDGLRAVAATVQSMDGINDQVETVAATIVSLSERTQTIGEIILAVTTMAERAHLLALNASIEAAAAGEHGRTFSVVAAEIKRFAEQARDATDQVRTNLGEIQQGINASVMLTEEAAKRVAAGRQQTGASERTIRNMAENLQDSVQAFQQIVAATNQHQIGLEQVMQALDSIRQAATQTATATRHLEHASADLNNRSEGLVAMARKYRL